MLALIVIATTTLHPANVHCTAFTPRIPTSQGSTGILSRPRAFERCERCQSDDSAALRIQLAVPQRTRNLACELRLLSEVETQNRSLRRSSHADDAVDGFEEEPRHEAGPHDRVRDRPNLRNQLRGIPVECAVHAYHSPRTFHQAPPIPIQITMLTTLIKNPIFHHAPMATYPVPKRTGAGPVP